MMGSSKIIRNYKTKENCVVDKIRDAFPDLSWIADKKVQDGCSSAMNKLKSGEDKLASLKHYIILVDDDTKLIGWKINFFYLIV